MNKLLLWFIILLCAQSVAFAKQLPTVNILTWWDYLNYPWEAKEIQNKCHVKISYDEYYSDTEFARRWKNSAANYDIIIFEDTMYPAIVNKIPKIQSTLNTHAKNYNPTIKKIFNSRKYPSNIAFFFQSVTGFLWNPQNIRLNKSDSLMTIFAKAKNNYVVILDDPIVFQTLLQLGLDKNTPVNVNSFNEVSQDSKVFITNDYDNIYTNSKFAFSYIWSGEAILDLNNVNKSFRFLVHPDVSYVSSDLLAQLNNKPGVACVANYITSKAFLTKLQNNTYYFSPYGDDSEITNQTFKQVYQSYLEELPRLSWVSPILNEEMQYLIENWKMIKLNLDQ